MQWIEAIHDDAGVLRPVYVDQDGVRTTSSLKECKTRMVSRGYQAANLRDVQLTSLEPSDASEYLSVMGMHHADPRGQDVFVVTYEGRRIHLPAAVLLQSLISRLAMVGDRLLCPASLPMLATPTVLNGALCVQLVSRVVQRSTALQPLVQNRFIWLTCFPSAVRMWGSGYGNATKGRLSLAMPSALVSASVVGVRSANSVYATRLSIKELTPTEGALPFAQPFVPKSFVFAKVVDGRGLAEFQAEGGHSSITSDDRVPRGRTGWRMADDEWHQVIHLLNERGYVTRVSTKPALDAALEKLGRGIRWKECGPHFKTARNNHVRWRESGKWVDFLEALAFVRDIGRGP